MKFLIVVLSLCGQRCNDVLLAFSAKPFLLQLLRMLMNTAFSDKYGHLFLDAFIGAK